VNTVLALDWEAYVAEAREQTHPCVDDLIRIAVADELAKLREENDALLAIARRVHAECGPDAYNVTCRSCRMISEDCKSHATNCLWLAADAMKKAGKI
jgi:hypothetical protein